MEVTIDPIIVLPSKITSVSPSLVAVSVDDSVPVPDDKEELEKLVESSDEGLDEVIKFGSLCLVMISEIFLSPGISTIGVVASNPVHHVDLGTLHDDETIFAGSKSKIHCLNKVDATVFYDDSPWAQIDGGASMSVTNLISLLHSVKLFDTKFKSNVYLYDATSKQIITPRAVGYMRDHALTRQGSIDVKCYYSPHFSTTLLSQVSVIKATGHPKQCISQGMQLFSTPNEDT